MPDSDPSALVIAFGKYRGLTVAELLARDPSYAQWLLGQAWLADRFAELHAALAGRGAAQDDTPEHNLIQARFTNPAFRLVFLETVASKAILDQRIQEEKDARRYRMPLTLLDSPATNVQFEHHGIDVLISWSVTDPNPLFATGYRFVSVEIKPSLGDDYPAVMRQIHRSRLPAFHPQQVLLIDSYAGRTIPYPQLREMFAANQVTLVTLREITDRLWPPEFSEIPD